ncbi:hypothetical protein GF336_04680 [Candidatus Woesearchaeota archaeon]|nr:hypothetical protein [Candidatus Woesearchaeota archaeon]
MSASDILKENDFKEEVWEEKKDQFLPTGYPAPLKRYKVVWEAFNMNMEEAYFWTLNHTQDLGYHKIDKTEDIFSASENSAFFGVSQQRIGLQQDKVSQYLATIGKMTKELFQLVRELRIIDERMQYYRESMGYDKDGNYTGEFKESSEITLKGIYIDMVQGGSKNPASIYGMAREVGFTSLPDLFFSTHPKDSGEVEKVVESQRGGFNKKVRVVLIRHLKSYLVWKENTFKELKTRRTFTLRYLRQHFDIIKMYMQWVRPYLKHIKRLTMDEDKMLEPQLISAFEGSMLEVEFLAYKFPVDQKTTKTNKKVYACILANFLYTTRPSMSFQQEGYQRGPIHVGKVEATFRAYAWDDDTIKRYKKMKEQQDLEMMKSISDSVKAAMDALGDEFESYLEEAGEVIEKEEEAKKEEKKEPGFMERLRAEFIGPKKEKKPKEKKPSKADEAKKKSEQGKASKAAKMDLFLTFKNFKKAHGMVMW